jgi:HSP20 family protein
MIRALLPAAAEMGEAWQPAADVYRTPNGWLVKLDLAGVRPEDVQLSYRGPHLTVQGMRRDFTANATCCCYQMEISYSQFARRITLPVGLDDAHIRAEYSNGMLLVHIDFNPEANV